MSADGKTLCKVSHQVGDRWEEHSFPPHFNRAPTASGDEVLVVGVPGGDTVVALNLLECIGSTFVLLYVLYNPLGEADEGRYQSPEVTLDTVRTFITRFALLLAKDARHDFWIISTDGSAKIVWERFNLIFAYGPLSRFEASLRTLGFTEGRLTMPDKRERHFHSELKPIASELMSAFEWRYSPLQEDDDY